MGYDLHITRAESWADNEGAEIGADEWLAAVRADPELTLAPDVGMGPHFARWSGPSRHDDPWLDWRAGNVYTKSPDSALLRKMVRLAERLGARVQGDDGELYTGDEPLDEPPDEAAAPTKRSTIRTLLGRLLGARQPGAPAPDSSALVHVYLRAERYYVEASDRTRVTEAGFWVSSGRVVVLDGRATDAELGLAILDGLARSRLEVPVPPRSAKLQAGLFRAMGVTSARAAMAGTRGCLVTRERDGSLRVEPFGGDASAAVAAHSLGLPEGSATTVGQAVRAALARAAVAE